MKKAGVFQLKASEDMNKFNSPLDGYKRHISRANHIIFKEVIDNIQNQNRNEQGTDSKN